MQPLRVNAAGLQAVAARWAASASELDASAAPVGLGLSCQASAVAVSAAHADVAAFTAALAGRIGIRASHVRQADAGYRANEAEAASAMAAVMPPLTGV